MPVAVDLHLLEQLDTPILGCATHHSRGVDADMWVQLRKEPGQKSILVGAVAVRWRKMCFFHLGFTGFQVPLALLCLFRTQICCASDQTATHNCDHSDKDPIVNPGGRLLSHSDTFANTAALAVSRWQYGNNLHKLDIACLQLWRTTTT